MLRWWQFTQLSEKEHPMTAKTIRLNLSADSSKDEEIAALHKIARAIPEITYLKSLFTDKLLVWVEQTIRSDSLPNVVDHFEWLEQTTAKQAEEKHTADAQEINRLQVELRETHQIANDAQRKIDGCSA